MEARDVEEKLEIRAEPKSVKFKIDKEARTVEFPFSSELGVDRGYLGIEVLDHRESSVDLTRLKDAAPLLFNHDRDKPIGVVESAYLKDKRGYVKVRFSDNPFPSEVFNDVQQGILRGVSTGYSIRKTEEDGDNQYRAVDWCPHEVSICSLAADPSVGIGRSAKPTSDTEKSSNMAKERSSNADATTVAPPCPPIETKVEMSTTPDLEVVRAEAEKSVLSKERARVASIRELCATHNLPELAKAAEDSGMSIEETRAKALDAISKKPVETVAPVELNEKEQCDYKISAGIRSLLTGDWSSREAGYVRELSREVESKGHKRSTEKSFLVPFTALSERATYVAGTANVGGNLIAPDLLAGDFIEALRNQSVMLQAGVKTMNGLVGDVAIPRRSGVGSTYWLSSETTAITFSNSTFDQISLSPKNLAAIQKHSRQVLLQGTPGIEELIRSDLRDGLQLEMDRAILNGSGSSGQPTGIMGTSGINSVAIGTNGGAVTLEKIVDLETAVMEDNGAVNPNAVRYLTNYKVMGALKKLRAGGSAAGDGAFLYNSDLSAIGRGGTPAVLNGYGVLPSNQVPSNLTKGSSSGVCSAIVYGDFSQCIMGTWGGGLEITVGEDADDFSKALTSIRGILTMDVAVRNPVSFGTIADITT